MGKPSQALLFVCMGNICRSPTAEAVFRAKVKAAGLEDHFLIDSAGTHDYHPGSPPDPRAQHHARLRGYELGHLRARAIQQEDFQRFDRILVMDRANLMAVQRMAKALDKPPLIELLLDHASNPDQVHAEVPDPYYGGAADFELALDLIEMGCEGLLRRLTQAASQQKAY